MGRVLAILLIASASVFGQAPAFQRTMEVGLKDPVLLDIILSRGDVAIGYSRDGEVSIRASAKDKDGKSLTEEFVKTSVLIVQAGSHITLRNSSNSAFPDDGLAISYQIDVPFRTEINSSLQAGNQKVIGVTGPVKLTSGQGDVDVMVVRPGLLQAKTGKGKISCRWVDQLEVETGGGNITLIEDGPSKAVVKKGLGRIEVEGARGSFEGYTDGGELHMKAVLKGDWLFQTVGGNIRVELPRKSGFEFDASTLSGLLSIEREEMQKPSDDAHRFHQQVGGGGKNIQARTISGNIIIQ